eukprot:scaffold106206_cov37-Prasinocladus_malaysianus.AAC.1
MHRFVSCLSPASLPWVGPEGFGLPCMTLRATVLGYTRCDAYRNCRQLWPIGQQVAVAISRMHWGWQAQDVGSGTRTGMRRRLHARTCSRCRARQAKP